VAAVIPTYRFEEALELGRLQSFLAAHPVIETCVVTASRTYGRTGVMREILALMPPSCRLRHGAARGGDKLAGQIWSWLGRELTEYPVTGEQWRITRGAGFNRNLLMLEGRPGEQRADICLAFIRDRSHGATHCAGAARELDIPTFVFPYTTGG
jgi:hypothetical protein